MFVRIEWPENNPMDCLSSPRYAIPALVAIIGFLTSVFPVAVCRVIRPPASGVKPNSALSNSLRPEPDKPATPITSPSQHEKLISWGSSSVVMRSTSRTGGRFVLVAGNSLFLRGIWPLMYSIS